MRKIFCNVFLTLVLVAVFCVFLLPVEADAATVIKSGTCGNNLTWTLDDEGTLTISGSGAMKVYDSELMFPWSGVPWDIDRSSIKNVIIKNGVTSIDGWAFFECTNLISVTIPDSVTLIDRCSFTKCASLINIEIPDKVTSIGDRAFDGCVSITSITLPQSIRNIGSMAFSSCKGLTTITIPHSNITIGDYAFSHCSGLTNVSLPRSMNTIAEHMFSYCTGLVDFTIPNSVQTIGYAAFDGCSNLRTITIPEQVKTIDDRAFYNCHNLETIYYQGSMARWESIDIGIYNSAIKKATLICDSCKHRWDSAVITEEATCTKNGVKTYICSDCGETKTETINKQHSWDGGVVIKQATCKDAGEKSYTCVICSVEKTETVAKLTTHTYDNACDTACNICGRTRKTSHKYNTAWSMDDTGHWHDCSICEDRKDFAGHVPGAAATEDTAQTCTICGFVIMPKLAHTHKYSDKWNSDKSGHWKACSGCEEKGNFATHTYDNECDTDCNVCGATRKISHKYKTSWSKDKSSHWHACSVCGDKVDKAAHTPGAPATTSTPQTCKVCGYELAPATGTGEPTTPNEDDVTEPENNVDESQTQPGNNVDGDGTLPGNNDIGNGTEPADTNDILSFALIIALVAAIIVGLLIFDRKKRK